MEFIGLTGQVYQSVTIQSQRENTNKKPGVIITNAVHNGVKIETKSGQLDKKPGYYTAENVKEFLEDTKTYNVEVIYCNKMHEALKIADDICKAIPPKKRRKTLGETRNEGTVEG
ncbi:MAG: hypothetical protein M0D57_18000 [Sphingobacteriales bacterium JAD_PAG50586_3]|nr:MAG: hypothetical protein M0D57_18000 [Sphingobacteriales bacterium JAD_PAG50586_3]